MKRDKLWNAIGAIGWILILLGGCGMDSESLTMPIRMIIAGLIMCCLSARMTGEWQE